MDSAIFYADGTDTSGYAWSILPLPALVHLCCPPRAATTVESVEFAATCPAGWHRSPSVYAGV